MIVLNLSQDVWAAVMQGSQVSSSTPKIPFSTTNMCTLRTQIQLQKGSVEISSHCMLCLPEAENKYLRKRQIKTVRPVSLCHPASDALG